MRRQGQVGRVPITRNRVTTQTLTAGHAGGQCPHQLRGVHRVRPCIYEIVFAGQADRTLCAQFDECTVSTGPDTTILRAELPDQAALCGLVERIVGLGLEIIRIHRCRTSVTIPASPSALSRPLEKPPARVPANWTGHPRWVMWYANRHVSVLVDDLAVLRELETAGVQEENDR
jgi:hypothetical protein